MWPDSLSHMFIFISYYVQLNVIQKVYVKEVALCLIEIALMFKKVDPCFTVNLYPQNLCTYVMEEMTKFQSHLKQMK